MGAWPVRVYICILGPVVSDKLEHQSTAKNKLASPSSIIILRCSMTFGQGIRYYRYIPTPGTYVNEVIVEPHTLHNYK